MKIAFVTNTCWNVFNFREGLVKFLIDRGDEVISLAPWDEYAKEIEKWGVKFIETPLDQTGTNPIKDLAYLRRIKNIFSAERPDVALCFTIKSNIYASLAGKMTSVPTICNVSGLGTVFLVKGFFGKIAIWLYRFAFRYSSHIFFQNSDDKELFRSNVAIDEGRIGVLPGSGIDLSKFNYSETKISAPTQFLMIARVIEEKGVREYAEAARLLMQESEDVVFTLIGALDESHSRSVPKEEVEAWVSKGHIKYYPHSNDITSLLDDAEVVILPSYREGTPRTLLEAAAKGRALLTSDVPGCREVVKDGQNGFLFKVKSAESIAEKAREYLSLSVEEKLALGRSSRKIAEETFDENLVIGAYVDAIGQMVDK